MSSKSVGPRKKTFKKKKPMGKKNQKVPYGYRMVSALGQDQEWKALDYHLLKRLLADPALTQTKDTWNLTQDMLSNIKQGSGSNQRIGRKITLRRIHLRVNIDLDNIDPREIRCMLILDTQCNGVAATAADIFAPISTTLIASGGPGGRAGADGIASDDTWRVNDFLNLNNRGRFKVLFDERQRVSTLPFNADIGPTAGSLAYFTFSKKCMIPVEYKANDFGIGSMSSNNLILAWCYCRPFNEDDDEDGGEANGIIRFRYSDS